MKEQEVPVYGMLHSVTLIQTTVLRIVATSLLSVSSQNEIKMPHLQGKKEIKGKTLLTCWH